MMWMTLRENLVLAVSGALVGIVVAVAVLRALEGCCSDSQPLMP